MKRIGILVSALFLCAFTMAAQDNSSSTTTTTTTTNSNTSAQDNNNSQPATTTGRSSQQRDRAAAESDENAADAKKEQAKNAGTKAGETRDKAMARLDDAGKILNELLTTPDNGIPDEVFDHAKCVAVVPSMIKGGFIFGAEHGRGVATCRTANGWSAPAFFAATGGSWGAQIGGQATDLVMLIMNQNGMDQLLASKFKIGGNVSAAAGPVGRDASASTDWKMKSEVLTYSRARGLFAGATLNGVVVKEDQDATTAYYGNDVGFRQVLSGQVKAPGSSDRFLAAVRKARAQSTNAKSND